jgi:hypothetical protein
MMMMMMTIMITGYECIWGLSVLGSVGEEERTLRGEEDGSRLHTYK